MRLQRGLGLDYAIPRVGDAKTGGSSDEDLLYICATSVLIDRLDSIKCVL
jgi:hypothetical protein